MGLSLTLDMSLRGALGGASYSPEALAIFAAFTTPPTAARKALINNAVIALKSAGIWATQSSLQVYAAADAQASTVDWISPSRLASPTNSPTFTADRGYTGDGATSFVNTNYTPSGVNYTLNAAQFAIWSLTDGQSVNGQEAGALNGASAVALIDCRNTSDTIRARINSSTLNTPSNTNGSGLFSVNRSAAAAVQYYRNDASLGSGTPAATALPNASFTVCKAGSTFSTRQIALFTAGASLDATATAARYNILLAYMQGVGAA